MAVTERLVDREVVEGLKQALVKEGLVSGEDLRAAEAAAERENLPLSRMLIKMGFVTEERLTSFIGKNIHTPYVDLKSYTIDRDVLELVPVGIARRYKVIPLFMIEDVLTIAMSDPMDIISIDRVYAVAGSKVDPVIASEAGIIDAIDRWYGSERSKEELVEEMAREVKEVAAAEGAAAEEMGEVYLQRVAGEPSIVKLVNRLIAEAVLEGASDIHLEPKRDSLAVRFRIDGFLHPKRTLPATLIAPVTSRIKIISGIDISNRRTPQDGRVSLRVGGRTLDIRASTFPSIYGENTVLRILDKSRGIFSLSELGFSDDNLEIFRKMILATKGLVLLTGPTGSGKTTTVYSAINTMNKEDKNIMTIEDPIEYEIDGVVQSQVNPKAGLTFANALRSMLRQDPDVIYIGEIRDGETADIAIHAALTGHLVFSALHTNSAAGAVNRLLDLGVEPGVLESILIGSIAQRLVRRICPMCKTESQVDESALNKLGVMPGTRFFKGKGCEHCNGIGYKSRTGIFEVMAINREIRNLIAGKASEGEIVEAAKRGGTRSYKEDGIDKAMQGITTIDEVNRVAEEMI